MNKLAIIIPLIAGFLSAGCGKQTDTHPETIQTNEIGAVTITHTDNGTHSVQPQNNSQLPKNFPDDVYLFHNAKMLKAFTTPESTMIGLETTNAVKTVAEHYQTNMLKNGWTEQPIFNKNELSMISFSKKERVVTVIITAGEAITQITLTLTTPTIL